MPALLSMTVATLEKSLKRQFFSYFGDGLNMELKLTSISRVLRLWLSTTMTSLEGWSLNSMTCHKDSKYRGQWVNNFFTCANSWLMLAATVPSRSYVQFTCCILSLVDHGVAAAS